VYSILSEETFREVLDYRDCVLRIKDSDDLPPVILVGNKAEREVDREVPKYLGQDLARSLGCSFLEVSGRKNINMDETLCSRL